MRLCGAKLLKKGVFCFWMEIVEAYEKLKEDSSFLEWKKGHEGYLAHFFTQLDKHLRPGVWEVGFYDDKKDTYYLRSLNTFYHIHPLPSI